jgi:2-polyprenyl-3-methyl-5-hydroxy-6-metoxy-1,4-benzoquinol methylase
VSGEYGYADAAAAHTHAYLGHATLAALRAAQARTVLDAGCGNGSFTAFLRDAGFEVAGLDASRSGIEQARRHAGIRFEVASVYDDLRAAVGATAPFDAVVSLEVIEHLYEPRRFLDRAREALRPRGLLVLSTPYHGYLKNLALAVTGKLDAHFTALWDGGHIKFWSRRTLTAALVERGFEVVSFAGAGRAPYLWKSMVLAARVCSSPPRSRP